MSSQLHASAALVRLKSLRVHSVGHQSLSERCGVEKSFLSLPGIEISFLELAVRSISHCTYLPLLAPQLYPTALTNSLCLPSNGSSKLKNGECQTNFTQDRLVLLRNFLVTRPDAFMLKVVASERATRTVNCVCL